MTSHPSRTRLSRARIIVIGERDKIIREDRDAGVRIDSLPDVFHALGEVAGSRASAPIAAAVIHVDRVNMPASKIVDAFRKIDPAVRLVLAYPRGHETAVKQFLDEGFDLAMPLPLGEPDIRIVMNGDAPRDAPREVPPNDHASPHQAPHEPPVVEYEFVARRDDSGATAEQAPPVSTPASPSGAPTAWDHHDCARADESTQGTASRVEALSDPDFHHSDDLDLRAILGAGWGGVDHEQHDPSQADDDLTSDTTDSQAQAQEQGDIDLVAAVLERPETVSDMAMRILRLHCGLDDVQFSARIIDPAEGLRGGLGGTERGGPVGMALVCCPATAEPIGTLLCKGCTDEELAPWAQWLGTWLSLNRKVGVLREWAFRDELTGAWNRRFFQRFVRHSIEYAHPRRWQVTIMVFDLDDFKVYNDQYGHEAGDDILRETVKLLKSVIREGDQVCRIGGDEFVVVFADPHGPRQAGSNHPDTVEQIARRFQDQICTMKFPKLGPCAPGTVTISAGLATYPWDGHTAEDLLRVADHRALESKKRGKNFITFGRGSRSVC